MKKAAKRGVISPPLVYLTPKGPVLGGAYRGGTYELIFFNLKALPVLDRLLYQVSLKTWGR